MTARVTIRRDFACARWDCWSLAAAAAVIEARQSFRDHGHVSMKGYLKQQLNCSGVRANRIRRRSALVAGHGDVGDVVLAGRVGIDQVDRLAHARAHRRAGHRLPEFHEILLDHAERLDFDDFDTVVTHFVHQADLVGSTRSDPMAA